MHRGLIKRKIFLRKTFLLGYKAKSRRTLPGNSGSRMRRRTVTKNLLGDLLADPDADAGTDHRDGKGRKAAGSVDAQQAEQKLAHKAAQHTHQDVAAKGSFRAHKTPGQISGQCTHLSLIHI